jgi:hypothetical protein
MRLVIVILEGRRLKGGAPRESLAGRRWRGNSLLEVQVAFAVLGVGLAGMCQLAVVQLRQVRVLEQRLQGQVVQSNAATGTSQIMLSAQSYYLVPWQNPWTRKVAGSAQIVVADAVQIVNGSPSIPCDPGPLKLPTQPPQSYPVNLVELDAPPVSQTVTAYVEVSAP